MSSEKTPAPKLAAHAPPCGAEYDGPGWIISRRDRKCDRPAGHPGVHREYITGVWWPNPPQPVPNAPQPPEPLTDDAPDAIDGMTPFELALALRFIAGFDPEVFARAVERVERHRAMLAKGV